MVRYIFALCDDAIQRLTILFRCACQTTTQTVALGVRWTDGAIQVLLFCVAHDSRSSSPLDAIRCQTELPEDVSFFIFAQCAKIARHDYDALHLSARFSDTCEGGEWLADSSCPTVPLDLVLAKNFFFVTHYFHI